MIRRYLLQGTVGAVLLCAGCDNKPPTPPPTTLQFVDQQVGTGAEAAPGKTVSMNYTGWLYNGKKSNLHGKKFDSSYDHHEVFTFHLGNGEVIKGWDQGIVGMKAGGKRTLIIPSGLAYGSEGFGGGIIPPNAALVFDLELVSVN